jgi:hypothetical protein
MKSLFLKFFIVLTLVLSLSFAVHGFVRTQLELSFFGDQMAGAYGVNFALAGVVFSALYVLREKFYSQLGFLFMAGSLLKYAVFFAVFHPFFKGESQMEKSAFFAFFTPYILALLIETYFLIRLLNAPQK